MSDQPDERVSRRRYERAVEARRAAEALLEEKSGELFQSNQLLKQQSEALEQTVLDRTSELRSALEKAKAAQLAQARFLATMSHEIRTPLGGLLGMIELVHGEETDPAKKELLEHAAASGDALKRIVNDVLDFSKMEAGAYQFQDEVIDIRALIGGVLALASSRSDVQEDRLRSSVSPTVPAYFSGDATRIRQVLSNLVSNACRYADDGPVELRAFASSHPKGALLRVEVEDWGVGISAEAQADLFKDFTQVHNKLTDVAEGTGLGLAISKRIIEGAGGQIGVVSTLGEGATFWFELPVEIVEVENDRPTEARKPDGPDNASIDGVRVLLAEDNKINQKLLMTFLKRMNIQADLVENGREAVEQFSPDKYDLVLMDVAMPEMDGLEATRIIKESWPPEVMPPIVVLTAHVFDAIHRDSAQVGIERVLSKPITFGDLRAAITQEIAIAREQTQAGLPRSAPAEPPIEIVEAASNPKVFDLLDPVILQGLRDAMGDDDVVAILTEFVRDAHERLEAVATGIRANNRKAVSSEAHALKGMAGLIGLSPIAQLASHLEDNGALDDEDLVEASQSISEQLQAIEDALARRA